MIERPDASKLAHVPFGEEPLCRVISARLIELGGARAIAVMLPLAMCNRYFQAGDKDTVCVYAELTGEHLQLYERASLKEWVEHSAPTTH